MKKSILPLGFLVLFVVGLATVQFQAVSSNPAAAEVLTSFIRDMPAPLYFAILVVFLGLVGSFFYALLVVLPKASKVSAQASLLEAQQIAKDIWRVDHTHTFPEGYVVSFQHFYWKRKTWVLFIRPGHPDVEKFALLKKGDLVKLESLEQGMECALEHELCAYLRIQSVNVEQV